MDLRDKVAIVTGGAKGIGKSFCQELLQNHVKVSIIDKDEVSGQEVLQALSENYSERFLFIPCDITVLDDLRSAFQKTVDKFGRIDIVISNAGILDEPNWRRMVEINFVGIIHGIKLGLEFMDKNGGSIINIGSNAAFHEFPLAPVYAACKHGVIGLTRNYGNDYHFKRTKVTVNALCPGATDTGMFHILPEKTFDREAAEKHNSAITPLDPNVVSKALIQLLLSDKNGAALCVRRDGSLEYC